VTGSCHHHPGDPPLDYVPFSELGISREVSDIAMLDKVHRALAIRLRIKHGLFMPEQFNFIHTEFKYSLSTDTGSRYEWVMERRSRVTQEVVQRVGIYTTIT
jgi:hypothetical protein